MWPPFCLTTSCKRALAFITTFRHKSSESARHNFTMWALKCLFLMKNMFNVTTVLPHNLLQTIPCIHHNFSTQVFRKRAAQPHYVGPELHYIFWPPWPPNLFPLQFEILIHILIRFIFENWSLSYSINSTTLMEQEFPVPSPQGPHHWFLS